MGPIDAIIFDKDGTLFDFRATWEVWAATALDRLSGGDAALAARGGEAIGFDRATGFRRDSVVIAGTTGEVAAALAAVFPGRPDLVAELDAVGEVTPQVPVRGLDEALDALGRARVLGVVTNDSEAPTRAHLAAAGIAARFRFVAGYDSGFGAKPEPGPLLAFARAMGVAPARTLMVGDSRHDLTAGRAAGMATVGVLTGMAGADDLADLADAVLPGIAALPDWLDAR